MIGIYYIKNKNNEKYYIGQSTNIEHRWKHHRRDLSNGTHHNTPLQNAWNKYGETAFEFNVIEECDKELLDSKEKLYIQQFESYKNGYNLDLGGGGCSGYKHTEEELQKMRQIQKPRAILQIDHELNIIKRWESCSHAAKDLGFYKYGIEKCCKRESRQKTIGGYYWVYEEEYNSGNVDWDYYLNINISKQKRVSQYDFSMNLIKIWDSITQINKELGYSTGEISCVCNGKKKSYKQYVWRFTDEYSQQQYEKDCKTKFIPHSTKSKQILQLSLEGEQLNTYNSLSEAAKISGFSRCSIQACCANRQKTAHGYVWKYAC